MTDDPQDDSRYHDFLEVAAKGCHCCPHCWDVPCAGCCAGGVCDDICSCHVDCDVDDENDENDE
jgi:hypothetical protein